ncbi:MAG: beta-N-acetylglucosaminidase domain-containing protein [Firmicutes bacterium]|nr:beta-N-acetylglucosaminidase domain-containing protein [Bacillota bacterium]
MWRAFFSKVQKESEDARELALPRVMPRPKRIEFRGEWFPLSTNCTVMAEDAVDVRTARHLRDFLMSKAIPVVQLVDSAASAELIKSQAGRGKDPGSLFILGNPRTSPRVAEYLRQLQVAGDDLNRLGDEGYLLAAAQSNGQAVVICAGGSSRGTFYALQTLKQLVAQRGGIPWLPSLLIVDEPALGVRGVIEGFYGVPWSHQERLAQLLFYGQYKMNTFIYAPKDDLYHRERWREPYPAEELRQLKELVAAAREQHVNFVFAISPGKSVRYSSDEDFAALCAKVEAVRALGVDSFALLLDDIPEELPDPADQAKFNGDLAAAQVYLMNRYDDYLKSRQPRNRLVICPTEYSEEGSSPYRERLARDLHPDILVFWTGMGVVAQSITSADAEKIAGIFGHDLFVWDNYPVNDFDPNALFMGPLRNRDAALARGPVAGWAANPMNQGEASKIALLTVADYLWNPQAYDPVEAWDVAIRHVAGDLAYRPMRLLCQNLQSSRLFEEESPELAAKINAFWTEYPAGDWQGKGEALAAEFRELRQLKEELERALANRQLLREIMPWLEKLSLQAELAEGYLELLMKRGSGAMGSGSKKLVGPAASANAESAGGRGGENRASRDEMRRFAALEKLAERLSNDPHQVCGLVLEEFLAKVRAELTSAAPGAGVTGS